jgi:hypothetical protein
MGCGSGTDYKSALRFRDRSAFGPGKCWAFMAETGRSSRARLLPRRSRPIVGAGRTVTAFPIAERSLTASARPAGPSFVAVLNRWCIASRGPRRAPGLEAEDRHSGASGSCGAFSGQKVCGRCAAVAGVRLVRREGDPKRAGAFVSCDQVEAFDDHLSSLGSQSVEAGSHHDEATPVGGALRRARSEDPPATSHGNRFGASPLQSAANGAPFELRHRFHEADARRCRHGA